MSSPDLKRFEKCIAGLSIGSAAMLTYSVENPQIIYANTRHELLTGYKTEELIGRNPKLFQGKNTDRKVVDDMVEKLKTSDFWDGEVINYTKSGKEYVARLTIFGIKLDGKKYYVAVKRKKPSGLMGYLKDKLEFLWKL